MDFVSWRNGRMNSRKKKTGANVRTFDTSRFFKLPFLIGAVLTTLTTGVVPLLLLRRGPDPTTAVESDFGANSAPDSRQPDKTKEKTSSGAKPDPARTAGLDSPAEANTNAPLAEPTLQAPPVR